MSRDEAYVLDILRAARLANEFLAGCEREAFETDEKTQSAVLHQLLVLGEAVKRLSDEFRGRHPGVPWQQIAGMRNWIIHQYADVDLDEVFLTVQRDLPELVRNLENSGRIVLSNDTPEGPDEQGPG